MNFIEFSVKRHGKNEPIFISSENVVYFYGHPDHKELTVIGLSGNVPYTLENSIDEVKLKLGIKPGKKEPKK
jgi:hypothetical protein